MTWRHILVATGLVLVSASAAADDATIEDFFGDWRGVELHVSGDVDALDPAPADLDVRLGAEEAGFHMSWTAFGREKDGGFGRQKIDASFSATDRPGVFAFEPGSSSLLSRLFADPATANPLEGEALLWARLSGATLTVYSLAIGADGRFDLDRYARTLTDQGMAVRYDHRIENDRILTVEGRVERSGG
jgi:hypothetical protein